MDKYDRHNPVHIHALVFFQMATVKAGLGKIAFITGGAQGIGRAIAIRLARDGYDISIAELPRAAEGVDATIEEIKGYGRKAIGVFTDVRKPAEIQSAIDETVDRLGPNLFVSIANAGVCQIKPLLQCNPEFVENEVRINLLGVINTHIAAAKQMIKQGFGGRILGASSIAGFRTLDYIGPYCATKFAVRGFTEVAAKEWGMYGIRVNAYAPGIVNTPMWDVLDAEICKLQGIPEGTFTAALVKNDIKLGRMEEPEDVAKLVSFLASDEAEYITGQTMRICGGAHM